MNTPRAKVRRSRALGIALTPKCGRYLERRAYPPGVHGRRRRNLSDYGVRLREKQRLRHQYNISESQLRRAFDQANRQPGKTGANLVAALETRLDAVVLRAGFARTIYQARQMVVHQHLLVNGSRVDRPSFRVSPEDYVHVAPRSRSKLPFQTAAAGGYSEQPAPSYLDVSLKELRAQLLRTPDRSHVPIICDDQLVVEFYSR